MSVLRAQVILKASSGAIRDNAVNTFHFNGVISDANLTGIMTELKRLYIDNTDNASFIGAHLSSVLTHVGVKIYDVTDEPAGPPLLVSSDSALPANRAGSLNFPEEVACAVSFAGTPAAGLDQSRRRGRVFLGPLRNSVFAADGSGEMRLTDAARDRFLAGFQDFAQGVDQFAEWVVYSRPYAGRGEVVRPGKRTLPAIAARPGTTVNIDQVSIDNAPDTQRRRGRRPTARTVVAAGA